MVDGYRLKGAVNDLLDLSSRIEELPLDGEQYSVSVYEQDAKTWVLDVYVEENHYIELIKPLLPKGQTFESFSNAKEDWIAKSLEGLPTVRVGRLALHGEHDKDNIRPHELGLLIEAALAFGTGHHGTTRGCLKAYVELAKARTFKNVLDVGTGTGVLGIAAAKLQRGAVLGTDIDPEATIVARGNAKLNAAPVFKAYTAAGLQHGQVRTHAPYDLIFANILQKPLLKLAPSLAKALQGKGFAILSGLLHEDVRAVRARYQAQGLKLVQQLRDEEWSVLVMQKN